MKITVDKNGYFTGDYAEVGDIENGVEYSGALPTENATAYKLSDGALVLDAARLAEMETEIQAVTPSEEERIAALEAAVLELITGGAA